MDPRIEKIPYREQMREKEVQQFWNIFPFYDQLTELQRDVITAR